VVDAVDGVADGEPLVGDMLGADEKTQVVLVSRMNPCKQTHSNVPPPRTPHDVLLRSQLCVLAAQGCTVGELDGATVKAVGAAVVGPDVGVEDGVEEGVLVGAAVGAPEATQLMLLTRTWPARQTHS
jgi:hypothetical protein